MSNNKNLINTDSDISEVVYVGFKNENSPIVFQKYDSNPNKNVAKMGALGQGKEYSVKNV